MSFENVNRQRADRRWIPAYTIGSGELKTNNKVFVFCKDSDLSGHVHVCMNTAKALCYPLSTSKDSAQTGHMSRLI